MTSSPQMRLRSQRPDVSVKEERMKQLPFWYSEAGMTVMELARMFGVHRKTIYDDLVKLGLKMPQGGPQPREYCGAGLHKMEGDNVLVIPPRGKNGKPGRGCRECRRKRDREAKRARYVAQKG